MLSLPVELSHAILDKLQTDSLRSVAGVCRAFRTEPQRRMYHTIRLRGEPPRAMVILQRILESPRFASFVNDLDIFFVDDSSGVSYVYKWPSPFFKLLSDVLHVIANLRYLRIRGGEEFFSGLQLYQYLFRLHSFILDDEPEQLESLLAFLTQQESLRCLEFRDYLHPMLADYPSHHGFLPNITTFSGNLKDTGLLSRHRPIRHIYTGEGKPHPWAHQISDITHLAGSSKPIECLGFYERLDLSSLRSLPKIFSHLSILILFAFGAQDVTTPLDKDIYICTP